MTELEKLQTEVERLTRVVNANHPQDPSTISAKTQNIYTLFAIIIALVGIPGAIGMWNLSEFKADLRTMREEFDELSAELRSKQDEFETSIERELSDRLERRVEDIRSDNQRVSDLADKKFDILRDQVLDSIGQTAGERQITLQAYSSFTPVNLEFNSDDEPFCRLVSNIIVTNETDKLTEVLSEYVHSQSPLANDEAISTREGYNDSYFNSLGDWEGRFLAGNQKRQWRDATFVTREHVEATIAHIEAGKKLRLLYEVNYKSGTNGTKTAGVTYDYEPSPHLLQCLYKLVEEPLEIIDESSIHSGKKR